MITRAIKVPDIGEGIAEVELVAWHVKPGDRVAEDQIVAEVMTDKAAVEIPSPLAGTVVALGGDVGQMLAVGSELVRIEVAGGSTDAQAVAAAAVDVTAPREEPASPPKAPAPSPARAAPAPASAAPIAPPIAAPTRPASPARAAKAHTTDRPIASPSVRRRAWELGVDLGAVVPTGPAGRVTHADVQAHAASAAGAAPAAATAAPRAEREPRAATAPAPIAAPPPIAYSERHDEEKIPVIGLRRRIAIKMQDSKRRIPHYSYVEEVDVTEVEALRARLNDKWAEQRPRLTLLPFLARAIVLAVHEHPVVNARFDDEAGVVTRYGAVHLGMATQTEAGLMVPVIRDAQDKNLWQLGREIARLADAARTGSARSEELSGSTLTITSLGPLGGVATTPVINRPEVAIIGPNRIIERPVFVADGAGGERLEKRKLMNVSISCDHRVVDGYDAAAFVQEVKRLIETPVLLLAD